MQCFKQIIKYLYIYIHQYSLVWLDTQDGLIRDRNLTNFTLDMAYNHPAISATYIS